VTDLVDVSLRFDHNSTGRLNTLIGTIGDL
jgi:hypothetical protein